MRLIDAERLRAMIVAMYEPFPNICNVNVVLPAIDNAPTIEAEPVRNGRWNYRHEDDWCYCTACGTDAEGSDGECLETDFCPNCGAKMYQAGGTISKERFAEIMGEKMDGGAENV